MRYKRFFRRAFDDFFRDFSGLGNIIILSSVFLLFLSGWKLITAIAGLAVVEALCSSMKLLFKNERPRIIEHENFLEKIQAGSFPSVHSAVIMYFGMVIISLSRSVLVDAVFSAVILIVGYSRYYLKKHYFIDIISGYIIGFLIFLAVSN